MLQLFKLFEFLILNASLIPCAAHRPPHQEKRKKSHSESKSCYCIKESHQVTKRKEQQKARYNTSPKYSQTLPGTPPETLKSRPGESLGFKIHERGGPNQPSHAQERPSRSQEPAQGRPRGANNRPKAPQSRPRDSKKRPRPFQNRVQRASRRGLSEIFVESLVRQGPRAILHRFFALCASCAISENHRKTYEKHNFSYEE